MGRMRIKSFVSLSMMLFVVFSLLSCGGKKDKKTDESVSITAADKVVKGAMRDYFEMQSTSCKLQKGEKLSYIMVELKRTATPFDFDVKVAKEYDLVGFGVELLDASGAVVGTQDPGDYVSMFDTDGKTDQQSQIDLLMALVDGETGTILIPVPVTDNVAKFRVTSILKDVPEQTSTTDMDSTVTDVSNAIDKAAEEINNDEDIQKAKKAMKQTKKLIDASSDLIDALQ